MIDFKDKSKRGAAICILLLILLTFFYFIKFYNYDLPAHDILTVYYPWAETLKISAEKYGDFWPLWTPYGFSGTPFLMKPILGYDSILGLLLLLLSSSVLALKLSYVFLFLLSGITMFAFMKYLKLENKYAIISALVYMLNGHMASKLLPWGWLTTLGGYALIPLIFLFGTKAIKEKDWIKNSIITGIIFSIMLRFGPDMKVGIWVGLIFGLYLAFNLIIRFSKKRLIKYALVSGIILLFFFSLSAQRILPNEDYISTSSRAQTSWDTASSRQLKLIDLPKRLIEPGFPTLNRQGVGDHIGIIAFLLVCFAVYRKWSNKLVLFFSLSAILSIMLANNTFGIYHFLWEYIPFFGSMRYLDRSLFIFVFACSVLAGIGASELFNTIKEKKKNIIVYSALILLLIANLWVFNYNHYTYGLQDWHNPYTAISQNNALQYISNQPGIFRIQTWETRGIDWGTDFYNIPLGLEHIYRYDSTWYPPYMNVYLSVANQAPAKLWSILNVKYITSMTELDDENFRLIDKFDECESCYPETEDLKKAYGPYLYENNLFIPRAQIIQNSVLVVGEDESAMQAIYSLMLDPGFDPRNIVIIKGLQHIGGYSSLELNKYSAIFLVKDSVDQNSAQLLNSYVSSGGILLPDLTKNINSISQEDISRMWSSLSEPSVEILDSSIITHNFDKKEIALPQEQGFLVLSEKFSLFPGWEASLNGKKSEILNADGVISAVYLGNNEKSIIFEYKPKSYKLGAFITIIGLLAVIAYFSFRIIKRVKKNAA